LLPGAHLHHGRAGAGDERTVRGCRDLAHLAQQLDIGRSVIKVVVPDHAAERLAPELPVFLLVDPLEDRALIPGGTLVALQRFAELGLTDIEYTNLQHFVGFGVVHEVMQAAPRTFELLEVRVMQDQVVLLADSVCIRAGSLRSLPTRSSAPLLPSM